MYIYICICIYLIMHIHIHMHTYEYVCIHTYIYMYMWIYVCVVFLLRPYTGKHKEIPKGLHGSLQEYGAVQQALVELGSQLTRGETDPAPPNHLLRHPQIPPNRGQTAFSGGTLGGVGCIPS